MSGKVRSKDLSYDSTLPPFLQRLHAQNSRRGDTDRHERPVARPRREKDPHDDDGPTIVDESGETLSQMEYDKLTQRKTAAPKGGEVDVGIKDEVKDVREKVTDGLATKKRKAGKVIGDEDIGDGQVESAKDESNLKKAQKKVKRSKPKLAFDNDEG
ncbi:hypothetical protein M433DRAFT_64892 [Acidomyces richmondensis BFW]|nr:MAG: hypothetical protein FE78DRAFT_145156 [Acidomyces sp. 'richmondensis']KYG46548.1 hypothetical protein M433DRAFT_64892 [Acidomyces richmondensis BFW]